MALLSAGSARPQDGIPSSSMADIAFLLLIFFLVTTVFPKDKGLAVVLPENIVQPVSPENVLHLLVQPDGLVEVRRGESPQVQRIAADEVEGVWWLAVAENPLLIAAVKTHPDAAYRRMVDVLDALQSAGAERVSIQMLEP